MSPFPSIDDPAVAAPAAAEAAPQPGQATTVDGEGVAAAAVAAAGAASAPMSGGGKVAHSLVLDTGALIKNEPPVSTLLAQASELYTIPAVLAEIRDAETRNRVDTTLRPFLKLRSPRAASVAFITGFARKTGDLEVLSSPDIHLLALTYELECERNGGDWRLRNTPAQKRLNGKAPCAQESESATSAALNGEEIEGSTPPDDGDATGAPTVTDADTVSSAAQPGESTCNVEEQLDSLALEEEEEQESGGDWSVVPTKKIAKMQADDEVEAETEAAADATDSDSDGWITPANVKAQMKKDGVAGDSAPSAQRFLQVALLTTDYAMQNVALRVNLNIMSSALDRITRLKSYVLRCHGCFAVTRDMAKQFCPKCGQPTLMRTSCSTDSSGGGFRLHLKRNFQWNNRGNVYSIPKPVHGAAGGKKTTKGGGKNGWGQELMLAEDQKEYVRAKSDRQRTRQRDLMDEDYLPGILTGERKGGNERIKVGAGRSVNSRKSRR